MNHEEFQAEPLTEESLASMLELYDQPEQLAEMNFHCVLDLIENSAKLEEVEREELQRVLRDLEQRPFFAGWRRKDKENPLFHHSQVLHNMTRIALEEKERRGLAPHDIKNLLVLAYLHDIGNGKCETKKVVNDEIIAAFEKVEEATEAAGKTERLDDAIELAIQAKTFREEHMEEGAVLVREGLAQDVKMGVFKQPDVDLIASAVREHDWPSIEKSDDQLRADAAVPEDISGTPGKYLFSFDGSRKAVMLELLREADRLFMLSVQGVIKDLKQKQKKGEIAQITLDAVIKQAERNQRSHEKEYALYAKAGRDDGGFINETLYRTDAGYRMFEESAQKVFRG